MQYVELMVKHLLSDNVAINRVYFWRTIQVQNKLSCDIFRVISYFQLIRMCSMFCQKIVIVI